MIPYKIALILPRLATDHAGELVAVRDALVKSLSAAGLDLHDLARACVAPAAPEATHRAMPSFGDLARAIRDIGDGRLTLRERAFVADMVRRGFSFQPSPRQLDWMSAIYNRLSCGRTAA